MDIIFYLLRKRTNKKGTAPIYCRITIAGMRSEFSTNEFIPPEHWENEQVHNHELSELINLKLSQIRNELQTIKLTAGLTADTITPDYIKKVYLKKETDMSLNQAMQDYIDRRDKDDTIEACTKKKDKQLHNIILEYMRFYKKTNVFISEINNRWGLSLIDYMINEKKYCNAMAGKCITLLRQSLHLCVMKDLIKDNPIKFITVKRDKRKPLVTLTQTELNLLIKKQFASKRLQHICDVFLFQCVTGFAHIDQHTFCYKKNVTIIFNPNTKLNQIFFIKERSKTEFEAAIPAHSIALKLLKKYNYNLPKISNQKYNVYLKEIALIVGIEKNLTTHVARKTFGQLKIDNGWSFEAVAKMMGHSSTKITQSTYANVGIERILHEQHTLRKAS